MNIYPTSYLWPAFAAFPHTTPPAMPRNVQETWAFAVRRYETHIAWCECWGYDASDTRALLPEAYAKAAFEAVWYPQAGYRK